MYIVTFGVIVPLCVPKMLGYGLFGCPVSTIDAPVPLRAIFTGFSSGSLDGIDRFALFEPADVGENTTSTVHVSDGAMACSEQLSF